MVDSERLLEDYFIGLDTGTHSVGWCAVNADFKILRKKQKVLCGVRLFNEADSAVNRRLFRSQRRRTDRKKARIQLLQSLFACEIGEMDQGFFQRLKDSFYFEEDKAHPQTNTLFNDSSFQDGHFHQLYPTIFHLRYALMKSSEKFDLRLIYLAIHHILKYRGHFLLKGESLSDAKDFKNLWEDFSTCVQNRLYGNRLCEECNLHSISPEKVAQIIENNATISDKIKKLLSVFSEYSAPLDTTVLKALASLICGGKVQFSKWSSSKLPSDNKESCSFKTDDFDAKREEWANLLGDDVEVLDKAKHIYDWYVLTLILKDSQYLSEAKVKQFNQYKDDLALLKTVMTLIGKKEVIFGNPILNPKGKAMANYSSYTGFFKKNGKKIKCKKCTYEAFIKSLKNILELFIQEGGELKHPKLIELQMRLNEPETLFLLRQRTSDNGVIPHQVHLEELKQILGKAKKHYSFLTAGDEYGTVEEKIIKLMRFRIPFYVGPLNDAHKQEGKGGFCWLVRRNENNRSKILPWNFDELVDSDACAERFMERLSSKCSYIPTEDVLPHSSIMYQKFMVLNEINNITICHQPIPIELKQLIFNELFLKYKKVTRKKLQNFLVCQGVITDASCKDVAGIDEEIKSNLSSLLSFTSIMKKAGKPLPSVDLMEKAIVAITKLSMEPDMLLRRIADIFPDLDENLCKKICAIETKQWGRLSKCFLSSVKTEQHGSILDALWSTNDNLMQLLSTHYSYQNLIDVYNDSCTCGSQQGSDKVADLMLPPSVRRGVRQSLKIIKELVSLMGYAPKKIFIEMARGEEEKRRTVSRRDKLMHIFKNTSLGAYAKELEAMSEGHLKSDKLYLYFTQLGKCMYSGEPIDINQLSSKQFYDIDHIIPYSKSNDDSLDNRVLVKAELNRSKSDAFPVSSTIRESQASMWRSLESLNLISNNKLQRLMRSDALSDDEMAGFINRQLVETRQSSKIVAHLLAELYPKSRIVYVKAGRVSAFRHDFGFIKNRELNYHHHGKDAYLCCVVGHVYDEKFSCKPLHFIRSREKYNLKSEKMFQWDLVRNGIRVWRGGADGSMLVVSNEIWKNNVLVCRMPEMENGGFYDQNPVSARDDSKAAASLRPIKTGDKRLCQTERYGGFNSVKSACYFFVEHKKGNKLVRSLEFLPIVVAQQFKDDCTYLRKYAQDVLLLQEPRILVSQIPQGSKFIIDGLPLTVAGRSDSRVCFNHHLELVLPPSMQIILQQVGKINAMRIDKVESNSIDYYIKRKGITSQSLINLYACLLDKLTNSIYSKITPSPKKKMEEFFSTFKEKNLCEQCEILMGILPFFQSNAAESKLAGTKISRIRYSKILSERKEVLLIHQSVTGLYSQAVNLLEL